MVDSNCDIPDDFAAEHDIIVLPMPFDLDGRPYNSGYWQEISGKEFYDALRAGRVAKTSQINIAAYTEVFTDYAQQGKELLIILLSSGLSSTYQSALIALQDVREDYPDCGIFVIDSVSATAGLGMLALLTAIKRSEGLSAAEAAAWLEVKKHSVFGFFTVDDLMYLHRGGRLNILTAISGSALNIRPVLNLAPDGTLAQKERVRGHKAALSAMVDQIKRSIAPGTKLDTILISHSDCPESASLLADIIKESVDVRDIRIVLMGPIIGAHLGPGAVTLLFEADMTREEYERRYY
jgi:DegV family protein with EDD domain